MKKVISLILVLCLAFATISVVAAGEKWTKASDWAKPELEKAIELGVYPASLENKDLTGNITRAEQAALTVKIYEAVTGKAVEPVKNPFTDTNDVEIVKAYTLGITSGTTETTFSPEDNLTREQAAAMLARVYKKITGKDTLDFEMPAQFADHNQISSYATESVYFMNAMGYIKGTNNGFEPQGLCAREAALAIAQRMASNLKTEEKPVEVEKEKFTIAFIGGSLTQGGTAWQMKTRNYFREKMPDKDIVIVNAGIGGTTSDYGAKRLNRDVLAYNPDLVVIEFAVNDRTFGTSKGETRHQYSMEAMIYQCTQAEKVPAVMFLYSNYPYPDDSTDGQNVQYSIKAKESLAKFYGIPTVDAHAYCYNLYENDKEKTSTSYTQWLEDEKRYYPKDNVHPYDNGYELFGDAIIAAFEEKGLEHFLKPVSLQASLLCSSDRTKIMSRYNYLYMNDTSKFSYNGQWYLCNKENQRKELSDPVPASFYEYPYYPAGIVYTEKADSTISFKCNAPEFFVSYISGANGNDIVVLVDGKEVKTISTSSTYTNMNYTSEAVTGVSGKVVTLKARYNTPLRICAIIERYNK